MEKDILREHIPCVPFYAAVLPNATVKLSLVKDFSVNAVKEAMLSGKKEVVIYFYLKGENGGLIEEEYVKDLYVVGVLCEVTAYSDEKEGISAYLKGKTRVRQYEIVFNKDKNFYETKCYLLPEKEAKEKDSNEHLLALRTTILDLLNDPKTPRLKEFSKALKSNKIAQNLIKKTDNLSILTDIVAQLSHLHATDLFMLLNCNDPIERSRILMRFFNHEEFEAEINKKIQEKVTESADQRQKEFYLYQQLKAVKEELGIDDDISEGGDLKKRLDKKEVPENVKNRVLEELKKLSNLKGTFSPEYSIIRNYVDWILNTPFLESSEVSYDLKKAKEILDNDHYGLKKVKDRILEYLAVENRNSNNSRGQILCLIGPPGIGKTSLGASIAKATDRKYVRLALGGVNDEAEIRGHRRTYVGAMPGRLIKSLCKAKVNNPVIILDEIDKVSSSGRGDPEAALLEVLDPEQNQHFVDNYLDLEYDLSKVLFIATANSYNISSPLLDRMDVIDISSYTEEEKFNIAKKFLIPKMLKECSLSEKEIKIEDEAIYTLIRYYTHEAGVRNLERTISSIGRKIVKRITLEEQKGLATISSKMLEDLLGPKKYDFTSKLQDNKVGIVNGLAWTQLGGDILQLEAMANEGKGVHILTGKLGDVMKESISAAITLVRSLANALSLDTSFYQKCDIHIHVPEGATPKDGPSAGVGMVTAIVSALTNNKVRSDVAMTGEITLRGDVLAIGGLKEKILAAHRGGIKKVLIPFENKKDLVDIQENILQELEIVPVKRIEEVLLNALEHDPFKFKVTSIWKKKATRNKIKQDEE